MYVKIKISLTLVCVLLSTSCSDFLDADLQGNFSTKTFYESEDQAIKAVNGAYALLAFTDVANCLWVFGDVASDDTDKGGEPGDGSDIGYIDKFEITSDNGYIEYIWQHYYEGITRANNVIYYVPNIDMDEEIRERIVGEGKFLRAYYYFNLVNIFGEIPLKTKPALTSEDLHIAKSPVDDIYAQIEEDLLEASELLPSEYAGSETGRATKGAALGLLAKVYLFEEKWQESLGAISSIELLDIYSLMPIYRNNFELDFENNIESVFEIQHLSGKDPFEGSYLNQYFSPQQENGYFFNSPTESLVSEFEATGAGVFDPRLDYSMGRPGGKWMNGEDFDPTWSSTGYMGKKHVQPLLEVSIGTKGDAGLNYTYMRFAEILLMKAEALNELGETAEALVSLNQIRKRARESYLFDSSLPDYGTIPENLLPDITSTSQDVIQTAIRHERRVELNLEFHRFFDLMRYGQKAAEEALSDEGFKYNKNRYFPIPQSELDANKEI